MSNEISKLVIVDTEELIELSEKIYLILHKKRILKN